MPSGLLAHWARLRAGEDVSAAILARLSGLPAAQAPAVGQLVTDLARFEVARVRGREVDLEAELRGRRRLADLAAVEWDVALEVAGPLREALGLGRPLPLLTELRDQAQTTFTRRARRELERP